MWGLGLVKRESTTYTSMVARKSAGSVREGSTREVGDIHIHAPQSIHKHTHAQAHMNTANTHVNSNTRTHRNTHSWPRSQRVGKVEHPQPRPSGLPPAHREGPQGVTVCASSQSSPWWVPKQERYKKGNLGRCS